jgi:uncharacterized protein (DUF427 family)
MAKAIWKGQVIAESDATVSVEGQTYFPKTSINLELLQPSAHTTVCGWKGLCNYYDVRVGDAVNANAAWEYKDPKEKAMMVKDHIAFWKGVEVIR